MSQPIPLDEARVQGIYDELEGMYVTLDSNPIIYGPKRLQEKVARGRNFLTQLEMTYLEVFRQLKWTEDTLRREQLVFNLEEKRLLAEDPEVRAERNIRDREARCHMKLRVQVERVNELEISVNQLQALIAILRTKRTDLKDVGTKLRDQMKLVHEEIALGGGWGSQPGPGATHIELRGGQGLSHVASDPEAVVNDIVGSLDGEMHLGEAANWDDDAAVEEAVIEDELADLEEELVEIQTEEDEAEDEVDRLLAESKPAEEEPEPTPCPKCGTGLDTDGDGDCANCARLDAEEAARLKSAAKETKKAEEKEVDKEAKKAEEAEAVQEVEMDDLGDIFADVSDEPAIPSKVAEPKSNGTEEQVDALLEQLPAAEVLPKSAKGPASVVVTEDIDSLIDMFS